MREMKASASSDRKLPLSPHADSVAGGSHCPFASLGKEGLSESVACGRLCLGAVPSAAGLSAATQSAAGGRDGLATQGSTTSITSSVQAVRPALSCYGHIRGGYCVSDASGHGHAPSSPELVPHSKALPGQETSSSLVQRVLWGNCAEQGRGMKFTPLCQEKPVSMLPTPSPGPWHLLRVPGL